jgi:hypothetical protein
MSELILNPNLRVRQVITDGRVTGYSLIAPVKGRGRLQSTIEIADASADVLAVLRGLVDADTDIEVDEASYAPLADLGVLVHRHEVSSPVTFSCRLDADDELETASLRVNPDIAVMPFADFVRREPGLAHALEPCEQIVLVGDPVTGARYPHWIDDRESALLQRLIPGAPPPPHLDGTALGRLAGAGILITSHAVASARQRACAAAAQFARHGYAELPQLLPRLQIAALRRYYRDLLDEGHVAEHDRQVPLRSAQHNERVMQYYHHQLCGFLGRIAGQTIKPSYGYFASYRRGATLNKHVDREQCKLTASLLLDYIAAPSDDPVWPLYLELPTTGDQIASRLGPGGCVLYRGCELPHYRYELRAERSTSFFLHYVDESFSGPLQ